MPAPRPRGHRQTPRSKGEELAVLKLLALEGADHSSVILTSREIGEKIGVSQQAADRYLVTLEKRGLLTRALAARRQRLALTRAAMDILRSEHHVYRRIFEGPSRVSISGTVVTGLGEGRYYLSQPGYVVQFSERLGYEPYPGTLNIRVVADARRKVSLVRDWKGIRIDGFEAGGRTFGGATCFAARINGRPSHLIIPDRTHYEDVIELIAREYLRQALRIKDGDQVRVEVSES
jgi:riboflavin kinase, archaea type